MRSKRFGATRQSTLDKNSTTLCIRIGIIFRIALPHPDLRAAYICAKSIGYEKEEDAGGRKLCLCFHEFQPRHQRLGCVRRSRCLRDVFRRKEIRPASRRLGYGQRGEYAGNVPWSEALQSTDREMEREPRGKHGRLTANMADSHERWTTGGVSTRLRDEQDEMRLKIVMSDDVACSHFFGTDCQYANGYL
ncbi:unnamed protein product [Amoebophrya sp. A25]|nr:unnamed protein product [Amoebophrya sp. A25]|eukprot:GSA25T00023916001.1